MSKTAFWCLFVLALALGLALRLPRLDARPMHHDEANQAVKFGALLETGQYRYDPSDHHGPTLYYLALPAAWLRGQATLAALDERTLRLVPVFFGVATILLFALVAARGLGHGAVLAAAILAAISPALTYYSRFYIQETVLVFFALGFLVSIGRYALDRHVGWAIAGGLFAGLAFATKETSVIAILTALLACGIARRIGSGRRAPGDTRGRADPWIPAAHVLGAVVTGCAVAALFYSSFGSNPAGVIASVRAFGGYFVRGLQPDAHVEPWYYYLRLLGWFTSGGLVWTEGLVLLLAAIGIVRSVVAVRREHRTHHLFWPLYIGIYSLLTCVAFSAIRYKTPWNLLPFYVGFVLMAGYGAAALLGVSARVASIRTGARPTRVARAAMALLLLVAAVQLAGQDWRANFPYAADPRNPYAYVQTSSDFLRLVTRVEDLARVQPDGRNMLVKVVAGPYEQWPLPWYLRRMGRVGYWATASGAAPLDTAPVVIVSADQADAVDAALGDRYQSEFYGLRPNVLLTLYIERGLWERFLSQR